MGAEAKLKAGLAGDQEGKPPSGVLQLQGLSVP